MISSDDSSCNIQKLEYIYEHFQENEKVYDINPDTVAQVPDNTLYPYINNDIENGLFEDVIDSYYLDSQIRDDFECNKECYATVDTSSNTTSQSSCTHEYDHITQQTGFTTDSTQQHKLYHLEEDAKQNSNNQSTQPSKGMHSHSKHKYHNAFGEPTYNIMILIPVMHSLFNINILCCYIKNYKTLTGVYMIPSLLKAIRSPQTWM